MNRSMGWLTAVAALTGCLSKDNPNFGDEPPTASGSTSSVAETSTTTAAGSTTRGDVTSSGTAETSSSVTTSIETTAASASTGTTSGARACADGPDGLCFGPPVEVLVLETAVEAVGVAEVTGDALADIVVGYPTTDQFQVLSGLGDGEFMALPAAPSGSSPRQLVLEDVDGDGFHDLMTCDEGSPAGVSVVLNAGGDGLAGAPDHFATGVATLGCDLGHLDGDLDPDVVVGLFTNGGLGTGRGNGDGSFAGLNSTNHANEPTNLEVGRINDDALDDVVIAHDAGRSVSVAFGDGNRGWSSLVEYDLVANERHFDVGLGDFDEDNRMDIATTRVSSDEVGILLNQEDGVFDDTLVDVYSVQETPRGLAVGDVNADGHLDIVVANQVSRSVSILVGDGAGQFEVAHRVVSRTRNPWMVALGDLNGDGIVDVVATTSPGAIVLLLSDVDVAVMN